MEDYNQKVQSLNLNDSLMKIADEELFSNSTYNKKPSYYYKESIEAYQGSDEDIKS